MVVFWKKSTEMIFAFKLFLGLTFVGVIWTARSERSPTNSDSNDKKTERATVDGPIMRTRYRRADSGPLIMSQGERIAFLATHNNIRKDISGSLGHQQPSAAGMMKMYWSAALEASAVSWSMKCVRDHGQTEVVKKPEFLSYMSRYGEWIGQNIYIRGGGGIPNGTDVITAFAGETVYYTYNEGRAGDCVSGQKCGHYTQVVWQTSFLVGCGYANCGDTLICTCNYSPGGNYNDMSPYKSGSACSLCASDKEYNFTECEGQLCAPKDRCSPVKECKVVDTNKCLCSESNYKEIVSRLLNGGRIHVRPPTVDAGAIHVGPPVVVFGLLLPLVAFLLGQEAQSGFSPALP